MTPSCTGCAASFCSGANAAAEFDFVRAIDIARSQQTRSFELRAALSLANFYQATGRREAARELLAPIVAGFTEGPELPEVEQANRLLADLAKRANRGN
jgi:predicted ATPase